MKSVRNNSHATLFVGIHGMGGIGKTTLAKTIYNQLLNQFEYHSFIADIREKYKNGVECLHNQLIHDILKEENLVRNRDEGIKLVSSRFKDKKVLILLDDVDADSHLEDLAGNRDWFSSGSVILITTRDKSILDNAEVDCDYELEEMDMDTSLIPFSRHAFGKDAPPSEFEVLTRDVVSSTGGLPLSLEVLGSFLRNKEPEVWEDTIKQLRNVPDKEVQKTLRITYDALEDEQQQIFLDIACFFIGTDLRMASYMWDACGFYPKKGIVVLRLMSLIKVGENHELGMHDQLRDLGREIVRQEDKKKPGNRSRLWDSKEVMEGLEEDEGTRKIEAISCSKSRSCRDGDDDIGIGQHFDNILKGEQFKKLKNLRFLDARGAHLTGHFKNPTKNLKWLQWHGSPSTFEANNFDAKELVVLHLSSRKLSDTWPRWSSIKVAKKLKYLNLIGCESLEKTSFLSYFENLEVPILRYCRKLKQIDSSIGKMKSMVRLDLTVCVELKRLPREVSKLEALEQLLLRESGIEELPESIGDLQNLEILDIAHTGIKELPDGIGRLRKLRNLNASCCGLNTLESLEEINIWECASIKRLNLPKSKGLKIFHTTYCKSLVEIQGLDTLESLEKIDISWCASIERLNLSKSKGLKIFKATNCERLVEIQGLDTSKSLKEIDIFGCASIERLNLPKSKVLKLYAGSCKKLFEIQGLDGLKFLKVLNLSGCTSFGRLPNICCFDTLQKLAINSCDNLHDIQGLVRFPSCTSLWIEDCNSLANFPNLSNFPNLWKLYLSNCHGFREIPWLVESTSLFYIAISGFSSVEILPDLSSCTNLFFLDVRNCEKLTELQGLEKLEHLRKLNIYGCKSLKIIPELPGIQVCRKYEENTSDSYQLRREFGEDRQC
ncbi:disease resistance protein RPV1-like [Rhodamnia argentea]|uniref:Disease resistance protein RPV1-like n=1 Tax=Rhodamnia argentea TaxID=178133 RepID=A0ABM3HBU4_9MYRT|nr:disease resistance protein RPV1-like [Rhodamnia argentea]